MDLPDRVDERRLPRLYRVGGGDEEAHDVHRRQLILSDSPQQHECPELHGEDGTLSLVRALHRDAPHRAELLEPFFSCFGHASTFTHENSAGETGVRSPAMYPRTAIMLTRYSTPSTNAVVPLVDGPRASGGSTNAMSASG